MGERIFRLTIGVFAVIVLAVEVLLPLRVAVLALIDRHGNVTLSGLIDIAATSNVGEIVSRSVLLSFAVSITTTALALGAALVLLFRLRFRPVVILFGLPLFMSGTQTALAQSQLAQRLAILPAGVMLFLSLCTYALPFALIALVVASRHISRALLDSGQELAAGRGRSILRMVLPMMRPAIAAAATVAFLVAINEGTRTFQLTAEPLISTYVDGKMAGGADALTYAVATVLYGIAAIIIGLGSLMPSRRFV